MSVKFISLEKFAEEILNMTENDHINFTVDEEEDVIINGEPTGWYGIAIIPPIFDEDGILISIGYYGGCETEIFVLGKGTPHKEAIESVTSFIENYFLNHENVTIKQVCMEVEK